MPGLGMRPRAGSQTVQPAGRCRRRQPRRRRCVPQASRRGVVQAWGSRRDTCSCMIATMDIILSRPNTCGTGSGTASGTSAVQPELASKAVSPAGAALVAGPAAACRQCSASSPLPALLPSARAVVTKQPHRRHVTTTHRRRNKHTCAVHAQMRHQERSAAAPGRCPCGRGQTPPARRAAQRRAGCAARRARG